MKDNINLNLSLRTEILEIALNLESCVNTYILLFLSIENPKKKAFSNKSGNLSFKNKIDLLFDLDILKAEEHEKLLLVMEFRNQFLHNIECSSFVDAVRLLGNDKKNKLSKYGNLGQKIDDESRYKNAFKYLYKECLAIINTMIQNRRHHIEEIAELLNTPIKQQLYIIDKYFDLARKIIAVCEELYEEPSPNRSLIQKLQTMITDDVTTILTSEELNQLRNEDEFVKRGERIRAIFKGR